MLSYWVHSLQLRTSSVILVVLFCGFLYSAPLPVHTSTPIYPLSYEFCSCLNENVRLCYSSLKDKVIILPPSKCAALTFERSAVKCKPLAGSDPSGFPAVLVLHSKLISSPQLQKVPAHPHPLSLGMIAIGIFFSSTPGKIRAFIGRWGQLWLFRQDFSEALMYKPVFLNEQHQRQ